MPCPPPHEHNTTVNGDISNNSINVVGVLTRSSSINLVPDVKSHVKFLSNLASEPEKHSKFIGEVKHGMASEYPVWISCNSFQWSSYSRPHQVPPLQLRNSQPLYNTFQILVATVTFHLNWEPHNNHHHLWAGDDSVNIEWMDSSLQSQSRFIKLMWQKETLFCETKCNRLVKQNLHSFVIK